MNASSSCPDKRKLVEYLLGKLPDPETEFCEGHIAQCDQCEDTILGLHVDDTLDELTREALTDDSSPSDSEVVKQLLGAVREIPSSNCQHHDRLTLERSAEITRHLSPPGTSGDIGSIGHYRITDLLGAGSAGVVYEAIDEKLDRVVALKILRPSLGSVAQTRFLAEAKSAAAVDHENVITIYEVGQDNKLAFMAMQLLPGETLDARLQREVILNEETTRNIAADVAAGLAAAHEKDLIHRDIKPANIWLTQDDRAKILDFGLARVVDDDPGFTSTGMIAGTPSYMSPEQAKGHALDGRSDLFSLGCIVYRAATGRQPFGATNVLATLQAIQTADPVPPANTNANVSQELSDLTMCLLEKLPANRPNSAMEVVKGLRKPREKWAFAVSEYRKNGVSDSKKTELKSASPKPKTRAGIGWFGQLATLLLLCALGGGFLFGNNIIRIITGYGELTIETDDPNVKIELLENGKVVRIIDAMTDKKIDIKEGKYTLQVAGEENSVQVTPADLSISRGGKEIVRVHSSPAIEKNPIATTEDPRQVNVNEGEIATTAQPEPEVPMWRSNEQIFSERRSKLEERIAELKDGLSEAEEKSSYELANTKLEQVELELDVCFQNGLRLHQPQQIAEAHSLLQKQVELLKRQKALLLPSLSADEDDDSPEWEKYRLLKTKRSLALGRLTNFESMHGLPNSLPLYDGKALHEYLEIIETERSGSALSQAYVGITKLSDQFGTRSEFLKLVRQLFREHGDSFNPTVVSNFRTAVLNSVSLLSDHELRDLVLHDMIRDGDASTTTCVLSLLMMNRPKLERVLADSDQLWETILAAQPESRARSLISALSRYPGLRPQKDAFVKKIVKFILAKPNSASDPTGRYTTAEILKFDPQSELLADRVKQLYEVDKIRAFDLYKAFDADSPAARDSIPFLVQLAIEKNGTYQRYNKESKRLENVEIETLVQYCRSKATSEKVTAELARLTNEPKLQSVVKSIFNTAQNQGVTLGPDMIALKQKLEKAAEEKRRETRVYILKYLNAASSMKSLKEMLEANGGSKIVLECNAANNSLIASCTKRDHERLEKLLKTADRKPEDSK